MKPINQIVCWASATPTNDVQQTYSIVFGRRGIAHWSRRFEYPWVMMQGRFGLARDVLDVGGGGDGGVLQETIANQRCKVISFDPSHVHGEQSSDGMIRKVQGDARYMGWDDCFFDRVISVSVLEHIADDVEKAVAEMWRVLKPGGRLIMTFDVADHAKWNHSIDHAKATEIMSMFGTGMPPKPDDVLEGIFDEIEPIAPGGPRQVHLNVLCFACDKAFRN